MSTKEIKGFDGKYRFLSNFSNHQVVYSGLVFKNAEAAFQAQKCPSRTKEFVNLTPSAAKRLGRRVPLRIDWEEVKDDIMLAIVRDKFTRNKGCREKLIQTGDAYLEEANDWGDTYWGTVNGKGVNMLGQILMQVREELMAKCPSLVYLAGACSLQQVL